VHAGPGDSACACACVAVANVRTLVALATVERVWLTCFRHMLLGLQVMQKNPYLETVVANGTKPNGTRLCHYFYPDAVRIGRARM
jgi:hypothetical protein